MRKLRQNPEMKEGRWYHRSGSHFMHLHGVRYQIDHGYPQGYQVYGQRLADASFVLRKTVDSVEEGKREVEKLTGRKNPGLGRIAAHVSMPALAVAVRAVGPEKASQKLTQAFKMGGVPEKLAGRLAERAVRDVSPLANPHKPSMLARPYGTSRTGVLSEVAALRRAGKVAEAYALLSATKKNPKAPRSGAGVSRRNPPKKEPRASKAVKRVKEALDAGVVLSFSTTYGEGTAGPYRTAVPVGENFAIFRDYEAKRGHPENARRTFETAYGAADHLVEWIGVGNAIDALKRAAKKRGVSYSNLDTPIRWR